MNKSKNNAKRNTIISSIRDARRRNVLTDPVNTSDVFNSHFASVGPKLALAIPQSKMIFANAYQARCLSPLFSLIQLHMMKYNVKSCYCR